jgi:hypothetical protein
MDCVFLLVAHWTTGRGNELMAPSCGLLDRTVYGRQESWKDSPAGRPEGRPCWFWRSDADRNAT